LFLSTKGIPIVSLFRTEFSFHRQPSKKLHEEILKLNRRLFSFEKSEEEKKGCGKPLLNSGWKGSEKSGMARDKSGSSNNRDLSNARLSFHSDDSFRPLCFGPPFMPEKPSCVPVLDFRNLSEYCDSDEEKLE
jgi:hypothetical protein